MLATATCGWLMAVEQQGARAALDAGEGDTAFLEAKIAATRFYLQQIVPAATGLARSPATPRWSRCRALVDAGKAALRTAIGRRGFAAGLTRC
jgi:hypothetical protein